MHRNGWQDASFVLFTIVMVRTSHFRKVIALAAAAAVAGCASSAERYPNLNLREFERVQGTFTSAAVTSQVSAPSSIAASDLADLEAAIRSAGEHHARFLAQAEEARPRIASAAGTGFEDNRWPIAQIEIASLESRNGEIVSLLADLDSLYSDASFSFTEREQIDQAREQVSDYHAAERQVIAELIDLLGSREEQP